MRIQIETPHPLKELIPIHIISNNELIEVIHLKFHFFSQVFGFLYEF